MKLFAIILAGGSGSRVNSPIPKQFISVKNTPLVIHTIKNFERHESIEKIIIVCNKDYIDLMEQLIEEYNISKIGCIVEGGSTGVESTMIGIEAIQEECDCVLVHDANRPIIDDEIIDDAIEVWKRKGNAVSAIRTVELTYRSLDEESSMEYIDRDTIWKTHTPQIYSFDEVRSVYRDAFKEGTPKYASTTEMYCARGMPIYFSKSKTTNIKITYPEDLEIFEALLCVKGCTNVAR